MPAAPSRSSASRRWRSTQPAAAAQRIITGIEKNEPRILIGGDARFMDLLQRLLPGDLLVDHGAEAREADDEGGAKK